VQKVSRRLFEPARAQGRKRNLTSAQPLGPIELERKPLLKAYCPFSIMDS
jgi:hypothetical protein